MIIKKLIFAPLFLIVFTVLIYQLPPILRSSDLLFSLSADTLIQLIILSALISLSSFLFILFSTLALDWKFTVPVGILASLSPLIFLEVGLALVLSVGILVSLLITYLGLESRLKSYIAFEPSSLLGPSVRNLASFLVLIFSFIYFLSVSQIISKSGFQIPDSLIDATLKFAQPKTDQEEPATPQLSIPPEQLDLLKKNPDLLKQSGLDPKLLDTLNQPQSGKAGSKAPQDLTNNLIKSAVKDQIQNFIKPYAGFVPTLLAILLFFTLQSLSSIINLLIYPLLWLIFLVLEKNGFVKFTLEQRPVKKMVI